MVVLTVYKTVQNVGSFIVFLVMDREEVSQCVECGKSFVGRYARSSRRRHERSQHEGKVRRVFAAEALGVSTPLADVSSGVVGPVVEASGSSVMDLVVESPLSSGDLPELDLGMDLDLGILPINPPLTGRDFGDDLLPLMGVGSASKDMGKDASSDISEGLDAVLEGLLGADGFLELCSGQDAVVKEARSPPLENAMEMSEDRMEAALRRSSLLAPRMSWISFKERLLGEFPDCPPKLVRVFWKGLRPPQGMDFSQRVRPEVSAPQPKVSAPQVILIEDDDDVEIVD